jgi:hypothetical protein
MAFIAQANFISPKNTSAINSLGDFLREPPAGAYLLLAMIASIGYVMAHCWQQVNENGQKWEEFFTDRLAALEKELTQVGVDLYGQIKIKAAEDIKKRGKADVLDVSNRVPLTLRVVWGLVGIISGGLVLFRLFA